MIDFINMGAVAAAGPLKGAHYPFPRSIELHEALSWCMTDYYTKAKSDIDFEARGLLVTGESRVGKTREIKRLISDVNAANVVMPDGRPGKFAHCILSGKVTWKDLGVKTLEALGYPAEGRRTQTYIWDMVIDQARRQGVIGIHFDECQHVFTEEGEKTNRIFLDSFKTLLKDSRWPLMLILSGIPELSKHVDKEPQLKLLLRSVHFTLIDLRRDMNELNELAFSYADKAGLNFEFLSNEDFFARLSHACANRWGLVIELIIEAFTICKLSGAVDISVEHFAEAFSKTRGIPRGFSPFTISDYRESFDPDKLLDLLAQEG